MKVIPWGYQLHKTFDGPLESGHVFATLNELKQKCNSGEDIDDGGLYVVTTGEGKGVYVAFKNNSTTYGKFYLCKLSMTAINMTEKDPDTEDYPEDGSGAGEEEIEVPGNDGPGTEPGTDVPGQEDTPNTPGDSEDNTSSTDPDDSTDSTETGEEEIDTENNPGHIDTGNHTEQSGGTTENAGTGTGEYTGPSYNDNTIDPGLPGSSIELNP